MFRLHFQCTLLTILLYGCGQAPDKAPPPVVDPVTGTEHQLEELNTTLTLPESFLRINVDEYINADSTSALWGWVSPLMQQNLAYLQFQDDRIDLFLDSSRNFSVLAIMDTQVIPLDKRAGSVLASQIKQSQRQDIERGYNTLDKTILRAGPLSMLSLRYEVEELADNSISYLALHYVTSQKKTYVIQEVSMVEHDLQPYLKTIKD